MKLYRRILRRAAAFPMDRPLPHHAVSAVPADCSETASPKERKRLTQGELVSAAERLLFSTGPKPPLIDIGVNLTDRSFAKDRPAVVARAREAGIIAMVLTGTCAESSSMSDRLCSDATNAMPMFYTAGVHPHCASSWNSNVRDSIRALALRDRCVAVGECGLDFNRNLSTPAQQRTAFIDQLTLAQDVQKPLFLHSRDADNELISILREHNSGPNAVRACVHCFTGSRDSLKQLLDMDVFIGITGWVCDERPERGGAALASLLPLIPEDRLMIETDAPYLTPRTIRPSSARPRRNEPALLGHVLSTVAQSMNQDMHAVAARTTRTAMNFFGLSAVDVGLEHAEQLDVRCKAEDVLVSCPAGAC